MPTRILLIEDELQIRENVQELLSLHNYSVDTAANGREGISQALLHPPDLILCDIMMPEVDGYQVLKTIRANRLMANVPFIFLTARADPADFRLGMNHSADDYLTKPFTFQNLLTSIDTRLNREAKRQADFQAQLEQFRHSLATVSHHEYNTNLSGVIGFSALMIDQYEHLTSDDMLSMAGMIKVCGLRLKRSLDNIQLIDRLQQLNPSHRDYSFFTSGQSTISLNVVEQFIKAVEYRQDRSVQYKVTVDDTVLQISEGNLNVCLEELIDNGFKFSDLTHPVIIHGYREATGYRLKVTNTGQLFTESDKEQIAPFKQFGRDRYEQQGFGVGLAIVKYLTELNQGRLQIDHPATGVTEASIWLPCEDTH